MQFWLPGAPLWLLSLVLMSLMTATNLFSVSSFGEFEFWFAGAEVATIAAAESPDPGRSIAKATNSVIGRIAVFYVGSVLLVVLIVPWNSRDLAASPYVAAFQAMNIPGAADVMNAVVLTAVLSCLNSGLYTSSRMLFVLAARREAPLGLTTVNKSGVPMMAVLASSVVGILAILVQMGIHADSRSQLFQSLGAWALVVVLYFVTQRIREREIVAPPVQEPTTPAARVLVLANQTVEGRELLDELRAIDRAGWTQYFVSVPANPIDTGAATYQGAVYMWDATVQAAQERLDRTLAILRTENLGAQRRWAATSLFRRSPRRSRSSNPTGW